MDSVDRRPQKALGHKANKFCLPGLEECRRFLLTQLVAVKRDTAELSQARTAARSAAARAAEAQSASPRLHDEDLATPYDDARATMLQDIKDLQRLLEQQQRGSERRVLQYERLHARFDSKHRVHEQRKRRVSVGSKASGV